MNRRVLLVAVALVVVSLSPQPAVTGEADIAESGITTSWPVEVLGRIDLQGTQGAARLDPVRELEAARLQAESVSIELEWDKGVQVLHSGTPLYIHSTDRDVEHIPLKDADIRFRDYQANPLFTVVPEQRRMNLTLFSPDRATLTANSDVLVSAVGDSPRGVGTNDSLPMGFWYTAEGPQVTAMAGGGLRVEGTFTLFVHDVVIDATGDGTTWSDWTGFWRAQPDAPVTEYEYRITTIFVEDGTFVTSQQETVELFSPSLSALVDGVVSVPSATGNLVVDDSAFRFDGDPLRLSGEGELALESFNRGLADESVLRMDSWGDFEVEGASEVEVLSAGEADTGLDQVATFSLGGLAVALLAVVVLARVGVVQAPALMPRGKRHEMWMQRGNKADAEFRFDEAARCYKRATHAKKDEPLAWFEWAHALLKAGHPEEAERIAVQGKDVPGMDPLDLLDLRASAAWERGDRDAFRDHLRELTEHSLDMARGLAADLEIDPAELDAPLRESLWGGRKEEHLDGYA